MICRSIRWRLLEIDPWEAGFQARGFDPGDPMHIWIDMAKQTDGRQARARLWPRRVQGLESGLVGSRSVSP